VLSTVKRRAAWNVANVKVISNTYMTMRAILFEKEQALGMTERIQR